MILKLTLNFLKGLVGEKQTCVSPKYLQTIGTYVKVMQTEKIAERNRRFMGLLTCEHSYTKTVI